MIEETKEKEIDFTEIDKWFDRIFFLIMVCAFAMITIMGYFAGVFD